MRMVQEALGYGQVLQMIRIASIGLSTLVHFDIHRLSSYLAGGSDNLLLFATLPVILSSFFAYPYL